MSEAIDRFRHDYEAALADHLSSRSEAGLSVAYELGRRALSEGISLLEIASIHLAATGRPPEEDAEPRAEAGTQFMLQGMAAFDMAQRGFWEAQERTLFEQGHVARLQTLAEASVAVIAHPSLADRLPEIAKQALVVAGGGDAAIQFYAEDGVMESSTSDVPAAVAAAMTKVVESGQARPSAVANWLAVPITGPRGSTSGVIAVWGGRDGLGPIDEAILAQFAQMASEALHNAQLFEETRSIAVTLQHSLLPKALPELPGLVLGARYLPGSAGLDVGGDWYDVFPLGAGRLGIVIGDVVGRGVPAAAIMGQLQLAVRACALEGGSPATVVNRVNNLIQNLDMPQMATLIFGVVEPDSSTLSLTSAGHPPPLVVQPDGVARFLSLHPVAPLGIEPGTARETVEVLQPGSTVVLYTDGLVERRGATIDDGLGNLLRAATGSDGDIEALCDRLVQDLDAEDSSDDVALLALRLTVPERERFELNLPGEPRLLAPARRALRQWLSQAGAERGEVEDLVLACGEAAANALEHAYGPGEDGFLRIEAFDRSGEITITVSDSGHWRPRAERPGGRGFHLMSSLTDEVEVIPGPRGTTVHLRRRLGTQPRPRELVFSTPSGAGEDGPAASVEVVVVRLEEEVDLSNAERLGAQVAKAVPNSAAGLVVDLSGVAYIDSAGISLLFKLSERLQRRRQHLAVVVPEDSPVRRVLVVSAFDRVVDLAASVEDASSRVRTALR
ncbi:MAG TPA: anti-sigma factor antagonist [Acidimicrobiales bacterium]